MTGSGGARDRACKDVKLASCLQLHFKRQNELHMRRKTIAKKANLLQEGRDSYIYVSDLKKNWPATEPFL